MDVVYTVTSFIAANLPAAICLVVGVILLGIEIFIPGFGFPGIVGIILVVIGIVIGTNSPIVALILILVILAILGIMIAIAMRSATRGRISKSPLILNEELDKESGFSSATDMEYFIGREGTTLTDLRPAGIGDFDGLKLDIVSEGEFIDRGAGVRIINVEGRRIVVRKT